MAAINTFTGSSVNVSAVNPDLMAAAEKTAMATVPEAATTAANPLGGSSRLYQLLTKLEKMLRERYAFDVFAKNSINFGIMVTYRQNWVPRDVPGGRSRLDDPARPEGDPALHDAQGDEEDARHEGARGPAPDPPDRVKRHGACGGRDRREGPGANELQRRRQGIVRRGGRMAGRVDPELRRRASQAVGARKARLPRERAEERPGIPAAAPRGDRHERKRGVRGNDASTRSRTRTTS